MKPVYLWSCIWSLVGACSASPSINVGNERDGSVAGSGGASGFGGVGGFGGGDETLTALITEPPSEMAIEVVTISCAGGCKQVLAIASGGNDPYAFTWNDGVTTAAREICADDDTTFSVSVNDTPIVDGEFPYAGQSVSASVTATVLQCPSDGGTPTGELCLLNGSFERGPASGEGLFSFNAPPWNNCLNQNPDVPGFPSTPDLYDASSGGIAPTDGATFAHLGWSPPLHEFITQALCATLQAGHSYSFTVDLATEAATGSAQLAVYGSTADCSRQELLWKSAPLGEQWEPTCVTITPSADADYLTFEPTGDPNTMPFLLVDHIVPVANCPSL